jgi:hypothetical protein
MKPPLNVVAARLKGLSRFVGLAAALVIVAPLMLAGCGQNPNTADGAKSAKQSALTGGSPVVVPPSSYGWMFSQHSELTDPNVGPFLSWPDCPVVVVAHNIVAVNSTCLYDIVRYNSLDAPLVGLDNIHVGLGNYVWGQGERYGARKIITNPDNILAGIALVVMNDDLPASPANIAYPNPGDTANVINIGTWYSHGPSQGYFQVGYNSPLLTGTGINAQIDNKDLGSILYSLDGNSVYGIQFSWIFSTANFTPILRGFVERGLECEDSDDPHCVDNYVRFDDVPASHMFFSYINDMFRRNITVGCSRNPPLYCPDSPLLKGQIAALEAKTMGSATGSTASLPYYDVPVWNSYAPFISYLLNSRGVSIPCTPDGRNFCPDAQVPRSQAAEFIVKGLMGDNFIYQFQPYFPDDVPPWHPQFKYIQKLRELNITAGCSATQFCPDDIVNRGQFSVFLSRAFPQ